MPVTAHANRPGRVRLDPIIDMLTRITSYDVGGPGDDGARTRSFCFPSVEWRTHHVHVVEAASRRTKVELAALDDHDRVAYRSGKAPLTERVPPRIDPVP
jgi:hypothetical protein